MVTATSLLHSPPHCLLRSSLRRSKTIPARAPLKASASYTPRPTDHFGRWVVDSASASAKLAFSAALALGIFFSGLDHADAKVGVSKPELLPKGYSPVIDVAGFLSSGQENRLIQLIESLEKDTGYKLRILAQNFPDTPGLAIKDFWGVDDRTIVFVADPSFGNILHFNVGATVDLEVPRNFWSRVAGKYGNMFYWKEKGEDASVEGAATAIANCLRNPGDSSSCTEYT